MQNPTYILGIHDGHNCGASLSCDGKIIASISEERMSRVKNEVGYPALSIEEVIKISGISPEEISVSYASLYAQQVLSHRIGKLVLRWPRGPAVGFPKTCPVTEVDI